MRGGPRNLTFYVVLATVLSNGGVACACVCVGGETVVLWVGKPNYKFFVLGRILIFCICPVS